jgi:hypothetical protein
MSNACTSRGAAAVRKRGPVRASLLLVLALAPPPVALSGQATDAKLPWQQADSTTVVDGRRLGLRISAWRDFMPRVGAPPGSDLMVNLVLFSLDSAPLPAGLAVDSAWVRSGQALWRASPSRESRPHLPNGLDLMLRGGPKWATDQAIDVLVRLRLPAGTTHYLQARRQPIGRTM